MQGGFTRRTRLVPVVLLTPLRVGTNYATARAAKIVIIKAVVTHPRLAVRLHVRFGVQPVTINTLLNLGGGTRRAVRGRTLPLSRRLN